MVKANEVYASKYVAASDLPDKPITVTIESVEVEQHKDEDGKLKPKLVVAFVGAKKRLILNFTNTNVIRPVLGEETDEWIGHALVLGKVQRSFKGRPTQAVGVLDVVTKKPTAQPPKPEVKPDEPREEKKPVF